MTDALAPTGVQRTVLAACRYFSVAPTDLYLGENQTPGEASSNNFETDSAIKLQELIIGASSADISPTGQSESCNTRINAITQQSISRWLHRRQKNLREQRRSLANTAPQYIAQLAEMNDETVQDLCRHLGIWLIANGMRNQEKKTIAELLSQLRISAARQVADALSTLSTITGGIDYAALIAHSDDTLSNRLVFFEPRDFGEEVIRRALREQDPEVCRLLVDVACQQLGRLARRSDNPRWECNYAGGDILEAFFSMHQANADSEEC